MNAAVSSLVLLALSLGLAAGSQARSTEARLLVLPTLLGEYRLVFTASPLANEEVRGLVILSPHLWGWESRELVPRLERCLPEDPGYVGCGARTPLEPSFFLNAQVNVDRGARLIRYLRTLPHPKELEPVMRYTLESLGLSLWLEETKLDFYRSWDPGVLRRAYGPVNPAAVCRAIIGDVERAPSREAKYHLTDYAWHNCVNDAARSALGGYPMDAWAEFLRVHRIEEQIIEKDEPVDRALWRLP